MRQSAKREATRQRMIDAAGRSFRQHGFAGIGVDAIAKEAQATSGAFYAHLGSKGAAFLTALEAGLDEVIHAIPQFREEHGDNWPKAFADYYLGKPHRDDLACGCAMTALSPDVMRGDHKARALYEEKMLTIANLIANGFTGRDKKQRAWAFLQILIGGLITSRAALSEDVAEQIAKFAKQASLQIALPSSAS